MSEQATVETSVQSAPAVENNSEDTKVYRTFEEAKAANPRTTVKVKSKRKDKSTGKTVETETERMIPLWKVIVPPTAPGEFWVYTKYRTNSLNNVNTEIGTERYEVDPDTGERVAAERTPGETARLKAEATQKDNAILAMLQYVPADQRLAVLTAQGLSTPVAEALLARMGERPSGVEAQEAATVARTETAKGKGKGKGAKQS
jgi:hypothetical protein